MRLIFCAVPLALLSCDGLQQHYGGVQNRRLVMRGALAYKTNCDAQAAIESGMIPPGKGVACTLPDVEIVRISEAIDIPEEPSSILEANYEYYMKMTVPGPKSQVYMSKLMKEAKESANFPGFKKGQVPPHMRSQMVAFCLEETINVGMLDALEAAGLKALSGANSKAEVLEDIKAMSKTFKPGTPLTFTSKLRAKGKADEEPDIIDVEDAEVVSSPSSEVKPGCATKGMSKAEVDAYIASVKADVDKIAQSRSSTPEEGEAKGAIKAENTEEKKSEVKPVPPPAAGITAAQVKELRVASGAGMMKCKEALMENNGDMDAAADWLRAKGLVGADKKADRETSEGLIATYIHTGGKLGVLVELNCETDFVSKGEKFAELCRAVAMQIAASPAVEFVRAEDMNEDVKEAERRAEMMSEDLKGKPEDIKAKMVEGRLGKILKTKVLLDQPYIRDPSITVNDMVKGYITTLGENINVARFVRFHLGGK